MGIHILILDENYNDVPEWDYIRQVNDRQFLDLIDFNDVINLNGNQRYFRPANTDALRAKIKATTWSNLDRYLGLCDLLDINPQYWLYFSF